MNRTENDLRTAFSTLPPPRNPHRLTRVIIELAETPDRDNRDAGPVRRRTPRTRKTARGSFVAALSVMLLIAALILVITRTNDHPARLSIAERAPSVTTTAGTVTLHHQAAWKFVPSGAHSYGDSSVLGYLTNEPTVTQCTTSDGGSQTSCYGPVPQLNRGGVLIEILDVSLAVSPMAPHPNTTISGYPAQREHIGVTHSDCPSGTRTAQQVTIVTRTKTPHAGYVITGCFSTDTPTAPAEFTKMTATATIHR